MMHTRWLIITSLNDQITPLCNTPRYYGTLPTDATIKLLQITLYLICYSATPTTNHGAYNFHLH